MPGLTYDRLSDAAIAAELMSVPLWSAEDGSLSRLFEFSAYREGVAFAVQVAFEAESLNHHPDLTIGYRKVRVSLMTHDAGGGLTAFDFELARRIDRI